MSVTVQLLSNRMLMPPAALKVRSLIILQVAAATWREAKNLSR